MTRDKPKIEIPCRRTNSTSIGGGGGKGECSLLLRLSALCLRRWARRWRLRALLSRLLASWVRRWVLRVRLRARRRHLMVLWARFRVQWPWGGGGGGGVWCVGRLQLVGRRLLLPEVKGVVLRL